MEVDRFKRLDDKANNQLRFTYILSTIYIALMKIIIIDKINEVIYILMFFSFIFLFLAWLFYFLSLRLTIVPKLPLTDEVFTLFKDKELMTIQYALHESIKKALNEYNIIILKKAKNLRYGYNFTIASVVLVILTTGYISYNNIKTNTTQKKELHMSEKNSSQTTSTPINNNQPEFDVKIPDIEYATDSVNTTVGQNKSISIEEKRK